MVINNASSDHLLIDSKYLISYIHYSYCMIDEYYHYIHYIILTLPLYTYCTYYYIDSYYYFYYSFYMIKLSIEFLEGKT